VLFELGAALWREGRLEEAMARWKEAIAIAPGYAEAHNNLGVALAATGRLDDATAEYMEALRLRPDYVDAHVNLAALLRRQGRSRTRSAPRGRVAVDPVRADAHYGPPTRSLSRRVDAAIDHYRQALRAPGVRRTNNLGLVLVQQGRAEMPSSTTARRCGSIRPRRRTKSRYRTPPARRRCGGGGRPRAGARPRPARAAVIIRNPPYGNHGPPTSKLRCQ
jgi:tetratricopeptide (TPR) repeat protein